MPRKFRLSRQRKYAWKKVMVLEDGSDSDDNSNEDMIVSIRLASLHQADSLSLSLSQSRIKATACGAELPQLGMYYHALFAIDKSDHSWFR